MMLLFPIVLAQIKDWNNYDSAGNSCLVDGVPTLKCFEVVFGNILFMASSFIIVILFIMFSVGSFNYLTSFGNADKIKKARGTLRYAVTGFILFIASFLILKTIDVLFLGNQNKIFQFTIGGD